jgi:hypothetical protein
MAPPRKQRFFQEDNLKAKKTKKKKIIEEYSQKPQHCLAVLSSPLQAAFLGPTGV